MYSVPLIQREAGSENLTPSKRPIARKPKANPDDALQRRKDAKKVIADLAANTGHDHVYDGVRVGGFFQRLWFWSG